MSNWIDKLRSIDQNIVNPLLRVLILVGLAYAIFSYLISPPGRYVLHLNSGAVIVTDSRTGDVYVREHKGWRKESPKD